jgi:hypothetical protein
MYREWARDFRHCERDCESAIRHLKNGTLFKWHEMKMQSIKSYARLMLAGVSDFRGGDELPDRKTNMAIPNDLATMERRRESLNNDYNIIFMTPRIADIVANVQQEGGWRFSWEVLNIQLRNPETRAAAGKMFQNMFLKKFQKNLSKMPPCFEMGDTRSIHPQSPHKENARAVMPWEGLGAQPTVQYISTGGDADGSYSEREFRAVIDGAMDKDSPPLRFLIPCAENWPSWDAAIVLYADEEEKRVVHVIFLQTTITEDHEIYAQGLNQVRDATPAKWKLGDGLDIHYHYVLVLLVEDRALDQIPKRRDVLLSSKEPRKDPSWSSDDLRQYVMFVRMKDLRRPLSQD